MTYRAVVEHARYWRGNPHRWTTVYQFVGAPSSPLGPDDAQAVMTADGTMCHRGQPGDQGLIGCRIYSQATGGMPVAMFEQGAWDDPGTWIAPSGSGWTEPDGSFYSAAEVALGVEWAAGLSSSGKPVTLRKWYHAVPAGTTAVGSPDLDTATVNGLVMSAQALEGVLASKNLVLGSASGRIAGQATVLPYFVNHQMPRGRRRITKSAVNRDIGPLLQLLENEGYTVANGS